MNPYLVLWSLMEETDGYELTWPILRQSYAQDRMTQDAGHRRRDLDMNQVQRRLLD